jgi:hypothetical protein
MSAKATAMKATAPACAPHAAPPELPKRKKKRKRRNRPKVNLQVLFRMELTQTIAEIHPKYPMMTKVLTAAQHQVEVEPKLHIKGVKVGRWGTCDTRERDCQL